MDRKAISPPKLSRYYKNPRQMREGKLLRGRLNYRYCRANNCQKIICLDAGAAHERAVHIWLTQQRSCIVRFYAAPVLNRKRTCHNIAKLSGDLTANEDMGLFSLCGGSISSGA